MSNHEKSLSVPFVAPVLAITLLPALILSACSDRDLGPEKSIPMEISPQAEPAEQVISSEDVRYESTPEKPVAEKQVAGNEVAESEVVEEMEEEEAVESAFDSNQWNTAVGLGGGAGGKYGGRPGAATPELEESTTESYAKVAENAFIKTNVEAISTFGVDVDTASYTNVRRFLDYGKLPPPAAVRVEEMINYFTFAYAKPKGPDSFSVTTERGPCPWNKAHELVLIGLQGKDLDPDKTPPRNLVFLIDVSGSMDSPDKLPLVQRSLARMVKGLTASDTVAIVTYAGQESVALPPTRCGDKQPILDSLRSFAASGSTNGAGGIQKAYELARQNFAREHVNRVILVTDGDFNVGVSDADSLQKLIEKERDSGVFLTVVGVGTGNLRDDRMSRLAKHGNGQYIYLDGDTEARRTFEQGLLGTLVTIAKDVKLQVEFNKAKVASYRLIGYERRVMKKQEFRDDKKDSGEIGAGHSVTALYEVVPAATTGAVDASAGKAPAGDHALEVRLRYKQPWAEKARETAYRMAADAGHTSNLGFAGAVATFGMILAKSAYAGGATMALVEDMVEDMVGGRAGGPGDDERRVEFRQLVGKARGILAAAKADELARAARAETGRNQPEIDNRDALAWLQKQQQADGSFRSTGTCDVDEVGLTGLATLAFLGDGSTLRSGPHKDVIKQAIKWLRDRQDQRGRFTDGDSTPVDHAIATLAMAEAHTLSKYKLLKRNVVDARNQMAAQPGTGARLRGWQILANEAFAAGGLPRITKELEAAAWKDASDLTQVVELLERYVLQSATRKENEPVPPFADAVLANPSRDPGHRYLATLAMRAIGGRHEVAWGKTVLAPLTGTQAADGSLGVEGTDRVYSTALISMMSTSGKDGRIGR